MKELELNEIKPNENPLFDPNVIEFEDIDIDDIKKYIENNLKKDIWSGAS